jgi:hypothetical protein
MPENDDHADVAGYGAGRCRSRHQNGKQIAALEDETQAAVFTNTVKQIKQAYRQ